MWKRRLSPKSAASFLTRWMEISEELSRLSTTTALNPPNSSWRTVWLPMYPAPPVTNILCAIIAEPEQWTETEKTLQIITIKKKQEFKCNGENRTLYRSLHSTLQFKDMENWQKYPPLSHGSKVWWDLSRIF